MCSEFVNFLIEEEKKKSFVEDEVKEVHKYIYMQFLISFQNI